MFPLTKGKITPQAHVNIPEGTFEEEHGRDGFYGPVSHLYRTHPPTSWTRIEGPLKPRAFNLRSVIENSTSQNVFAPDLTGKALNRLPVLKNKDVVVSLCKNLAPMSFYVRNADGDEVIFVHKGNGILETDFGPLYFEPGDYLVIPRGTTYRLLPECNDSFFLIVEAASRIRQPDRGLLGQHALYDPACIKTPEPCPILEDGVEWEVRIKRLNAYTSVFYPFNPMDVVGWKGDLSVWQLNVRDIRPVMSHRAHLAPSVHTTFIADGFVLCTFVPRPLEEEPGAQRVPFFHRNIDYDEMLFYHDGDFFSRDGISPGMLTLHPLGIHHGPHPKAIQASLSKTRTDEVAVMLDANVPLEVTEEALDFEIAGYEMSWQ
jgi:homogentisate 1,2-dioxygenase